MKRLLVLPLLVAVIATAADAPALKKAECPNSRWGYLQCYSKKITRIGGHSESTNFPKPAPANLLTKDAIILAVDLTPRAFGDGYEGLTLRLVNATSKEAVFPAADSRLFIVQEALDGDGNWNAIEAIPQDGWCGNSFHTVSLAPKEAWEFVAPRYSGPIKTKLRFKLSWGDGKPPIYSETFDGSIYPGQGVDKEAEEEERLRNKIKLEPFPK